MGEYKNTIIKQLESLRDFADGKRTIAADVMALTIAIAALEACGDIDIDRHAEICKAETEGRLVVLPVPIGAPVYVTYKDTENDGTPMEDVDELHLSGYFKEGNKEYYLTYDDGCYDTIEPKHLFVTREDAEKALGGAVRIVKKYDRRLRSW